MALVTYTDPVILDSTGQDIVTQLTRLANTQQYTAGDGININNNVVSTKVASDSQLGAIKVGDGLSIDGSTNELSVVVDSALSTTSENPVQNKVITNAINAISSMSFEVVQELPTTDIRTDVIYLVPKSTSQTNNTYDEYICLDATTTPATWEKIGDTQIDLSNYIQKSSTVGLVKNDGTIDTDTFIKTSLNEGLVKNDGTVDTTVLSDVAAKLQATIVANPWDANTTYMTGNYVIRNNELYRCKEDFVSGAWNSAKWQKETIGADISSLRSNISGKAEKYAFALTFDETTNYYVGNYVWHNEYLYQCKVDHTAGAWNSAHFDMVLLPNRMTSQHEIAEFFDLGSYAVGDYCFRNNLLYKCTTAHSGQWDASHFTHVVLADELKANTSALNEKVSKSNIVGLLKNDGTVDTNTYARESQLNSYFKKDSQRILGAVNMLTFPYASDSTGVFNVNDDGTISLQGSTSGRTTFPLTSVDSNYHPPTGSYIFNKGFTKFYGENVGIVVDAYNGNTFVKNICENFTTSENECIYEIDYSNYDRLVISVVITNSDSFSDSLVKPMVIPSSYIDFNNPYVPFAKTNKQLTDEIALKANTSALADYYTRAEQAVSGQKNFLPNELTSGTTNEVTVTVNADGSTEFDTGGSTASATTSFKFYSAKGSDLQHLNGKIFSGLTNGISGKYVLRISMRNSPWTTYTTVITEPVTISGIPNTSDIIDIDMFVYSGATLDHVVVYPMISFDGGAYVPFAKTNKQLTDDVATIPTVSVSHTGTASSTGVRKEVITINNVNYDVDGSAYMEQSVTLSTSATTDVTFTNAILTANSVIDVGTSKWGVFPTNVDAETTVGTCVVTMPKVDTAITVTVRIYVK